VTEVQRKSAFERDSRSERSRSAWEGFVGTGWQETIDLAAFIRANVQPWSGDHAFLKGATERTRTLWNRITPLLDLEREKGVLDVSQHPSDICAHPPGYIDRDLELIVGLQTDAPLKRAIMPKGGWRVVAASLEAYGYAPDPQLETIFTEYAKTHNDGVFDAYSPTIRAARKSGIITGLPDAYGRGRIIGDYRRVALYGVDRLIAAKEADRAELDAEPADEANIRAREEHAEQIRALEALITMGESYGFDLRRPAETGREAIQWTYLAYLAAIKQQNGAAMSVGRVSTFFDIYLNRDIEAGRLDERQAQELIDDFVIKLRLVRFLRTPDYNQLFSGDPVWATEVIGGVTEDGRSLVTRTSFRMLNTLRTLGPAPEPNLTVLWSEALPEGFKRFCAEISAETSAIQYENDDLMRPYWGDDYGIACCVSAMRLGRQMQFFGARVNLAKTLLYAINGGRDEITGEQIGPEQPVLDDPVLDYDTVRQRFDFYLDWLARTYVEALNIIHYMHDKYCYESLEMALLDREVYRTMAYGIAGLSVAADSLSAIKYAQVRPILDERGLVTDFERQGEFPCYGNLNPSADDLAVELTRSFMAKLRHYPTYRDAVHTQSVLTITSNVVYGKATGNTPDGRRRGEPFAPGANPMNGRDTTGALATMLSVAKLPYADCQDGISLTLTLHPGALGTREEAIDHLVGQLDAYFDAGGFHANINVLRPETLEDAIAHPENYPNLTVRVSGYAVNFVKLTPEQQRDIINRTFHRAM
jgi:formate C-acetyltransferase